MGLNRAPKDVIGNLIPGKPCIKSLTTASGFDSSDGSELDINGVNLVLRTATYLFYTRYSVLERFI